MTRLIVKQLLKKLDKMTTVGKQNLSNREKWLERTLKNIPAGSKILDAGAGELQYKKFCSHLVYISQDFAEYNGTGDKRGLQPGKWDQSNLDIISDIISIPESDASFNAIMCIEVLEHIPEPFQAIKEFSRLLKTGGHLIITAPFCSLTHMAPYHFYAGYNRYFYETHLPGNGFEIIDLQENGNYFEYIAQEIRRIPDMINQYTVDTKSKVIEKIISIIAIPINLFLLERLSNKDKGSSELLNFGYFVHAVKKKV